MTKTQPDLDDSGADALMHSTATSVVPKRYWSSRTTPGFAGRLCWSAGPSGMAGEDGGSLHDPALFGQWFARRASWRAWEVFLGALFGLPLDDEAVVLVLSHCHRTDTATLNFRLTSPNFDQDATE